MVGASALSTPPGWRRLLTTAGDWYLLVQPPLGVLVWFSVLLGTPPLWLSWTLFLAPSVVRWFRYREIVKMTPFDIPIGILFVGLLIGFFVSPDRLAAAEGLQTYLASILIYYWVVANAGRLRAAWPFYIGCLLAFGLLASYVAFGQTGAGARVLFFNDWLYRAVRSLPRLLPLELGVNSVGSTMGAIAPALLAYTIYEKRLVPRAVCGVLAVFAGLTTVLSASSSGLIAALAGFGFLLLIWKPWTLAILVPAAAYGLWLVVSYYHPAWQFGFLLPIDTLVKRFEIWGGTITLLSENMFTGLGLGAFFGLYHGLTGTNISNPHNNYLQLYCDAGAFGALAMLGFLVLLAIGGWRLIRRDVVKPPDLGFRAGGIATLVAIVAYACNGIFEVSITAASTIPATSGLAYHFVAIPYIWGLLALFAASGAKTSWNPFRQSRKREANPTG